MSITDRLDRARRRSVAVGLDLRRGTISPGGDGVVQALAGPVSGVEAFGRSSQKMSHAAEQLSHFQGYPYAIIRTIAARVASLEHIVARAAIGSLPASRHGLMASKHFAATYAPPGRRGKIEGAVLLTDHPCLTVLHKPNPIMHRSAVFFVTVAAMELTGRAFWWLTWSAQGVPQIWPLPPSWVEPDHALGLYSRWRLQPPGFSEPAFLPAAQVAYFAFPDPADPLGAYAPLQAMARSVVADEYTEEAQRRSMANGCNPGLAVTIGRLPGVSGVPGSDEQPALTVAQRNQILAVFKAHYRGVMNMDEPLLLDALIKDVKKITNTPREMDFLNSGKSTKDRLAQGWQINPIVMGQVESANRASSAMADDHFLNGCVNPRVTLISEVMTAALPSYFSPGDPVEVFLKQATSVDSELDQQLETKMVDRGAMSRNEWRARHGLPPIHDGNLVVLPTGVTVPVVLESDPKPAAVPQLAPPGNGGGTPGPTDPPKPPDEPPPTNQERSLLLTLGAGGAAAILLRHQEAGEKTLKAAYARFLIARGVELRPLFAPLCRNTLPPDSVFEQMISTHGWAEELKEAVRADLLALAVTGAAVEWRLHQPWGRGFLADAGRLPDRVVDAAEGYVKDLLTRGFWNDVVVRLKGALGSALRRARAAVLTGEDAVAAVLDGVLGPAAAYSRADTLARTESVAAVNGGSHAAATILAGLGAVRRRQWWTREDERVRPTHEAVHGQIRLVGEPFLVGGYPARFPGDPNLPADLRCGCRCVANDLPD